MTLTTDPAPTSTRLPTYQLPALRVEVTSLAEARDAVVRLLCAEHWNQDITVIREDGEATTVNVDLSLLGHRHGLVNATPDPLTLMHGGWVLMRLPPSGLVLQAEERPPVGHGLLSGGLWIPLGPLDDRRVGEVTATQYGQPTEVPDPHPLLGYVVPATVRRALPDRHDLYVAGAEVRDAQGRLLGHAGLLT